MYQCNSKWQQQELCGRKLTIVSIVASIRLREGLLGMEWTDGDAPNKRRWVNSMECLWTITPPILMNVPNKKRKINQPTRSKEIRLPNKMGNLIQIWYPLETKSCSLCLLIFSLHYAQMVECTRNKLQKLWACTIIWTRGLIRVKS